MKKARALFTIVLVFVIGFLAGATIALLTKDRSGKVTATFGTRPQVMENPFSIELMEKIEDLKEDVRLDPENAAGWLKLGNIYFDDHHYREAIEAYRQYLSLKPEDNHVRTRMGIALRGVGDFDGAIEEFRKVAQSDPAHGESRFQLGLVLLQDKKEVKKAIKAWEDYLQVEPKGERANWVRTEIQKMRNIYPSINEREGRLPYQRRLRYPAWKEEGQGSRFTYLRSLELAMAVRGPESRSY